MDKVLWIHKVALMIACLKMELCAEIMMIHLKVSVVPHKRIPLAMMECTAVIILKLMNCKNIMLAHKMLLFVDLWNKILIHNTIKPLL